MPNLLNTSHTGSQINEYLWKALNKRIKGFLILKYWKYSSLLISTCTKFLDYRKQENHCKAPLFTYGGISPAKKIGLFLGKYCPKIVLFNRCKFQMRGSKILEILRLSKAWCLDISDLVNNKIAKFIKYQSHGWSTHSFSVKNVKIEKQKSLSLTKLF